MVAGEAAPPPPPFWFLSLPAPLSTSSSFTPSFLPSSSAHRSASYCSGVLKSGSLYALQENRRQLVQRLSASQHFLARHQV